MKFLQRLLDRSALTAEGERPRLRASTDPAVVYAVGDVHGCLDLLEQLEGMILADAASYAGEKWLVMLGDYVDRGPRSAGVIEHLLAPPPDGFTRLALAGNHEAMMLDFLAAPSERHHWLGLGGTQTLQSYGLTAGALRGLSGKGARAILESSIPSAHRRFIEAAPSVIETPTTIFVHAGLRPGLPLEQQSEDDLLWYRPDAATDYTAFGKVVVHGHTPLPTPLLLPSHINIDTGAFATARLTAVRLVVGHPPVTLTATGAYRHS
ncbi:metallophosphoesterase family protein [Devosia sp. 1566]|uniref:metallophosphoesterase family protein n=1 Tax=Devosia sp. 1566 TaxID=2499144 RepID=UPI0013E3AC52|nr:metallophosphoesterase family protein [Devosia sp. 1566]